MKSNKQLLEEVKSASGGGVALDPSSSEMVFVGKVHDQGNDAAHEAEVHDITDAVLDVKLSPDEQRCFKDLYSYVYGQKPSLA